MLITVWVKFYTFFLFLTKNLRLIEESKFRKFSPAKNQFSKKLECFFPHSFKICKTSPFLSRIGSRKRGRECRQSSSLSNPLQPLLMPHLIWDPRSSSRYGHHQCSHHGNSTDSVAVDPLDLVLKLNHGLMHPWTTGSHQSHQGNGSGLSLPHAHREPNFWLPLCNYYHEK